MGFEGLGLLGVQDVLGLRVIESRTVGLNFRMVPAVGSWG